MKTIFTSFGISATNNQVMLQARTVYNRGLVSYKAGDMQNAQQDYQLARQLTPSQQWKPYHPTGIEEIIGLDVDDSRADLLSARAALLLEYSLEHALQECSKAIEVAPSSGAHVELLSPGRTRPRMSYRAGTSQDHDNRLSATCRRHPSQLR